jgi:hypothetical protein
MLPAGAVLVCAAIEVYTLADRSRGEPRNLDVRRYVLGEIFDAHRVEQRFLVRANGLSSVTIHPRPASSSPTGTVVLQLRDVTDGRERGVVQRVSTPLVSLAQSASFSMRFAPQSSLYREYALEVTVEGGSDGQGIGLLASRGEGYRGATLHIDGGRARWGDLIFETTVDGATSNFGSIASQLAQGGIPAPRVVLLLVLLAKYAALFLVIRVFAQPAAPVTLPPRTAPSP